MGCLREALAEGASLAARAAPAVAVPPAAPPAVAAAAIRFLPEALTERAAAGLALWSTLLWSGWSSSSSSLEEDVAEE